MRNMKDTKSWNNLMKLINIDTNKYFHMIPLWESPMKLPVELPVANVSPGLAPGTTDPSDWRRRTEATEEQPPTAAAGRAPAPLAHPLPSRR